MLRYLFIGMSSQLVVIQKLPIYWSVAAILSKWEHIMIIYLVQKSQDDFDMKEITFQNLTNLVTLGQLGQRPAREHFLKLIKH